MQVFSGHIFFILCFPYFFFFWSKWLLLFFLLFYILQVFNSIENQIFCTPIIQEPLPSHVSLLPHFVMDESFISHTGPGSRDYINLDSQRCLQITYLACSCKTAFSVLAYEIWLSTLTVAVCKILHIFERCWYIA